MPSVIVSYTLNDNSFDINWRCASITLRSPRAAGELERAEAARVPRI